MKILIDMNLSPRWVEFLVGEGIDAAHWSHVGNPKAADEEIMRYAARWNHVVLTHDLDFGAILAATQGEKPSVVQLRMDDVRPESAGRVLAAALKSSEREIECGALLTIEPKRERVRLLPLRGSAD